MIPAPRQTDARLKDWWVENPWKITTQGKSLSGYERNRVFLNARGQTFYEISALTSADSEGDGRSVVATDFNGDGMQDLIVRQAGGGSVLAFENQFPKSNWLAVSLRGVKSNRLGIGARLVARIGSEQIVRELYPSNGFKAQNPALVHLGLASASKVDELVITWPSGLEQRLKDVAGNRSIRITEGVDEVHARSAAGPGQSANRAQ